MQADSSSFPPHLKRAFQFKILSASRSVHAQLLELFSRTGHPPDDEFVDLCISNLLTRKIEELVCYEEEEPLLMHPCTALRVSILTHAERILSAADMIRQGESENALVHLSQEFECFEDLGELAPFCMPVLVEIVPRVLSLAGSSLEDAHSVHGFGCDLLMSFILESEGNDETAEFLLPFLVFSALKAQRI